MDELLVWAGMELMTRPTHRTRSPDELVHLTRRLVEVGAHTVAHPVLSTLPTVAQRDEIQRSRATLEEILGHPVTSFSYPHGSRTAETVAVVREAGFTCACSSIINVVRRGTDCFQSPRVEVRDWDGEVFAHQLKEWLHG